MKKVLKFPSLILLSFLIRLLVTGAGIGDALVMIALCAVYAGHSYLEHIKEPIANKDLINRITEIEEQVKINKEVVHSIKLGASLKR